MFRWYEGIGRSSQGRALGVALLCMACCTEKPRAAQVAHSAPTRATSSLKPDSEAAQTASEPVVVFLGDSLSAGLHLPADQAFPALLQAKLAEQGAHFRLINAGVSGDTTAGGLRRVDWLMKQKPALVVLELGANDGLRGLPIGRIEENLRALIDKIRAGGAEVLLLGMRVPPSYGADYADRFAAVFAHLAEQLHVRWVPFFLEGVAGHPELLLPDGLHPNREGQARIAMQLAEPLREALTHAALP